MGEGERERGREGGREGERERERESEQVALERFPNVGRKQRRHRIARPDIRLTSRATLRKATLCSCKNSHHTRLCQAQARWLRSSRAVVDGVAPISSAQVLGAKGIRQIPSVSSFRS